MCGIAGIITTSGVSSDRIRSAGRALSHRGPDENGHFRDSWQNWTIDLLHARLAILDLSGGKQPMTIQGGAKIEHTAVFNGEIFNYKSLKETLSRDLNQTGTNWKTESDTEVLLRHWDHSGIQGLTSLNGMFAAGIWSSSDHTLTLIRDRFGIKPLYYSPQEDGGIAFASEVGTLLALSGHSKTVSRNALARYFYADSTPANESMIHGIYKLPPGKYLRWSAGKLAEPNTYFDTAQYFKQEVRNDWDFPEAVRQVETALSASVERQLIADVPVGIWLSGGIDSSLVAAIAREVRPASELHSFSVGFDVPSYDESTFARTAANHLGLTHHELILSEANVLDQSDALLGRLDEPLADPSFIPTALLARMTAQHVKVALGGDGGDELFSGYPTYWAHSLVDRIPAPAMQTAKVLLTPLLRAWRPSANYQSLDWKLKRFFLRHSSDSERRHHEWMSDLTGEECKLLFGSNHGPLFAPTHLDKTGKSQRFARWLDFTGYLPNQVLTKVDRASMAFGVELRPPFLDNQVASIAWSIRESMHRRGKNSKLVLRTLARSRLPESLVHRKKQGFALPLARWLRGPLAARVKQALSLDAVHAAFPDPQTARAFFDAQFNAHQSGKADFSRSLWAFYVLARWMEKERML